MTNPLAAVGGGAPAKVVTTPLSASTLDTLISRIAWLEESTKRRLVGSRGLSPR